MTQLFYRPGSISAALATIMLITNLLLGTMFTAWQGDWVPSDALVSRGIDYFAGYSRRGSDQNGFPHHSYT
jgi:hypothetical protein